MKSKTLKYLLKSGKNSKAAYYLRNFARYYICPKSLSRRAREALLRRIDSRADRDYIIDRAEYYCKLREHTPLASEAMSLCDFKYTKSYKSVYFFDSYEYLRYFSGDLKLMFAFGDVVDLQEYPSIVKSRPLAQENQNSVLLNMDKVRHFTFVKDTTPYAEKIDKAIFRGEIAYKPRRIDFFEKCYNSPLVDAGEVGQMHNPQWRVPMISIGDHFKYKFVMALEGNDVASNLKWVMASNSIAVMPRPTCETWFMEGRLIPNYHYIEIKADYSDLEERLKYYIDNEHEALQIVRNANEWVAQFRNRKREKLISLLVLDRYFRNTQEHA